MLMIRITHKDTKQVVTIAASAFKDYCEEHRWNHNDAKVVIGKGHIHYEKCYLTIYDEPCELVNVMEELQTKSPKQKTKRTTKVTE